MNSTVWNHELQELDNAVNVKTLKFFSFLIFCTTLTVVTVSACAMQAVIATTPAREGNYCHLKFPAIREETLYTDRPILKDPAEGDMIDFYGPCDHDPLGEEEIQAQRRYHRRQERREAH